MSQVSNSLFPHYWAKSKALNQLSLASLKIWFGDFIYLFFILNYNFLEKRLATKLIIPKQFALDIFLCFEHTLYNNNVTDHPSVSICTWQQLHLPTPIRKQTSMPSLTPLLKLVLISAVIRSLTRKRFWTLKLTHGVV